MDIIQIFFNVDSDNVAAYTVYGLIYMEGWQTNKNRLDLAKLLLDEGKKRNDKYAPLQNAYGLYHMRRAALNLALQAFTAASSSTPSSSRRGSTSAWSPSGSATTSSPRTC
ncbi:MAG: hypothetical protein HC767_14460 [Akkermansiaceae bacterium]|nr:hypothetical protein [Akkermansiaceae bacterium]